MCILTTPTEVKSKPEYHQGFRDGYKHCETLNNEKIANLTSKVRELERLLGICGK